MSDYGQNNERGAVMSEQSPSVEAVAELFFFETVDGPSWDEIDEESRGEWREQARRFLEDAMQLDARREKCRWCGYTRGAISATDPCSVVEADSGIVYIPHEWVSP